MVSSIRISDETYDRLLAIKQELESQASQATGAKTKITFTNLLDKIMDVYHNHMTRAL